jgi:hypothetical protein
MKMNRFTEGLILMKNLGFKYYISVGLFVAALMWVWGYVSLMQSNAYKFALQYVERNQFVIETTGNILSNRPGFLNFKRRYSGGVWTARFHVVLTGEKKSASVFIRLEGSDKGWEVKESTLSVDGLAPKVLDPSRNYE